MKQPHSRASRRTWFWMRRRALDSHRRAPAGAEQLREPSLPGRARRRRSGDRQVLPPRPLVGCRDPGGAQLHRELAIGRSRRSLPHASPAAPCTTTGLPFLRDPRRGGRAPELVTRTCWSGSGVHRAHPRRRGDAVLPAASHPGHRELRRGAPRVPARQRLDPAGLWRTPTAASPSTP